MQIKWQKDCRVLSTVKEITLGREQEKLGEVGCGDGSQRGLGESTHHRRENRLQANSKGSGRTGYGWRRARTRREAGQAGAQGRTAMEGVAQGGAEHCGSYGR